ncbi:MAG: PQQ-dependent sugar dehydrogenase [Pseudomonadota bacterium]
MLNLDVGRMRRSAVFALAQAVIVALIVPMAFWLSQNFEFFPRNLIPVWTRARLEDLLPTVQFMAGAAFFVFFFSQMFFGSTLPSTARRMAIEVYAFAVAVSAGSVAMFFFSMTVFDPELLLGVALLGVFVFCAGHAILANQSALTNARGLLSSFGSVIGEGAGLIIKFRPFPFALAAALLTTTPMFLAYKFKSDREFADAVTAFRMSMLPDLASDAKYTTVNAFPGLTFLQPMLLRFDPNDRNRAYVLERAGGFYTFDVRDPVNSKELMFDLSDEVQRIHLETGAQGFAFHPDYIYGQSSGKNDFFLYYTSLSDDAQTNYLVSMDLSQPTPEARVASKFNLIELGGQPNASHNGGYVEFGADGFLYFSIGDRLDYDNHQVVDRNLYGGIFRIDVDQAGGDISAPPPRQPYNSVTAGYYIPVDNPLVGTPDAVEEYYAWGLRNPFRFSFDDQGRIWAGEVGAATWEEVNLIVKGGNYQWPFAEGYLNTETPRPDPVPGIEVEPVFNYVHTAYDRAIIGGFVVRDARLSALNGRYVFGDNFSGNLFAIDGAGETVTESEIIGRVNQYGQRGLTSFAMSPDGEILVTTMGGRQRPEGDILKLVVDDGTIVVDETPDALEEAIVASAEIGFERFNDNCATCHGRDAVVTMIDLGYNMPDFTDPAYHATRSDDELREILKYGGGRLGVDVAMPPWELLLSDEEIESVVLYLRDQSGGEK